MATATTEKQTPDQRRFGPLVSECQARGIGRTVAFKLAKDGTVETFHIGRRTFVLLDSLDSLPDRLAADDKAVE